MSEPNRTESPHPDTSTWERVHPLSPLARFWIAILVLIFTFGRHFLEDALEGGDDAHALQDGVGRVIASLSLLAWLGLVGLVVLVIGVLFWSWWFTRYSVTDSTVRLRQGVIFRTDKQARLDRVQSIEVTQPFFARLIGLAELRFDVADSGDSTLHLQYLRKADAEDLRARLLGRKREIQREEGPAGAAPEESAASVPEEAAPAPSTLEATPGRSANRPDESADRPRESADGPVIARMSVGRAVGSTLLSGVGLWFILVLLAAGTVTIFVPDIGLVTFIPTLLGFGSVIWSGINEGANFRISRSGEGFRVRHGLTSTTAQSIPLGRIQAIGIDQPPLWRILGWFRIRINSAGLGTTTGEDSRHVLLPAGTGQDLLNILTHVVPSAQDGGVSGHTLRAALEGSGEGHGFVVAPRRSRWLDPLSQRRNGYADAGDLILLRGGWLHRRLSVVPHARTQSAAIFDGPLTRRLGLASVRLDSVGGTVHTTVEHLAVDDARTLIRDQARRASFARRLDAASPPANPSRPAPSGPTETGTHHD